MFHKDCIYIHKTFGPCKFVSEDHDGIKVELFHSIVRRETKEGLREDEFSIQRLLVENTRVFVESGDFWVSGNVISDQINEQPNR